MKIYKKDLAVLAELADEASSDSTPFEVEYDVVTGWDEHCEYLDNCFDTYQGEVDLYADYY